MYLKKINLINFRNYEDETINFKKNINYIIGQNGQGKTNLVEAIYYTFNSKSFKTSREIEITRNQQDFFTINLDFIYNKNMYALKINKDKSKKELTINNVEYKNNFSKNKIKLILFLPDHLKIIKESPNLRRSFLDEEIMCLYPIYSDILKKYKKVINIKNNVLKKNQKDLLDIYNEQLLNYGKEIIKYRISFLKEITPIARKIYYELTDNKEKLNIHYRFSFDFKNFKEELENNKSKEFEKRQSIIGPHRDDLVFYINDENARNYGSQGQQRSVILSIKIAELLFLKEKYNLAPIILLDDVFSELDEKRKNYLLNIIKREKIQSFITLSNYKIIKDNITKEDNVVKITDGKVSSFDR